MLIQDNRYTGIPVYDVMCIYIYTHVCMHKMNMTCIQTKYDKTLDSFGHRRGTTCLFNDGVVILAMSQITSQFKF